MKGRKAMRKWAKKCMSIITLGAVAMSCILGSAGVQTEAAEQGDSTVKVPQSTNEITIPDNPAVFRDLSSDEIIREMGAGWNLGNTMDGHTGLTPWRLRGNPLSPPGRQ